jgi:hypothetical protein
MSGKRAKQRRKATSKKSAGNQDFKNVTVNLLKTVQILEKLVTESLCDTVFKNTRSRERQRVWSLYELVRFWHAVILRAPQSLTQALEAATMDLPGWTKIEATPEAFFQRGRDLSWKFFQVLYQAFVAKITPVSDAAFAQEWKSLRKRFSHLWIVDGSRLDAITHRLKILWKEEGRVLPGCLMACYDLFRGYAPLLHFSEDAAESEMARFEQILPQIPENTLVMGDRIYAMAKHFKLLSDSGKWGLFRRHANLKLRKVQCLSRERLKGAVLEDWLVEVGTAPDTPRLTLRWIHLRVKRGGDYEWLTNVLDPKRLSAQEVSELYPDRWNVERLFYDLKEVLNLHRFYAANVNAVGMQVYAAAMVYVAMRVAQARIAKQVGLAPEKLSTEKFFPRMAAAVSIWTNLCGGAEAMRECNRGIKLKEPRWDRMRFASVRLDHILVEERHGPRTDTRKTKKDRQWKSLSDLMAISKN